MEKNKTGKYLKYAIGEIALVMIGILLALQVNNWNEERIKGTTLKEALNQVKQDLKQDEINLKSFVRSDTRRVEYLLALSNDNYSNIKLDSIMYNLDNYFFFYKSNNSYSSLKSSGLFTAMKNDSLKSNLTAYYEQMYERLKTTSEYGESFTNDRVIPFVLSNLEYSENLLVNETLVKEKITTTNLLQLAKYQINVKRFSLNLMHRALEMNGNLREDIEKEIDNLK
ncbi:hypothetical protein SAMN04515667_1705 [Formosa sp. Hel1_31_208]|uniref:DUF6090 family protein n=1 Tax=Formosa sp. Hel1_31_208 TaxID=1798225 RepID=UPI00087C2AE7|nr:DUF6090 family protein [Formosa sp. Hel1_31_208]SDS23076.1 hypothetical protein SAMN04515667_1705 [Formosa sp. Hel1_31_208]